ncbi:endospore germination permease [Paenibacillus sp. HB172176]|uniref:GerAB/ArcD/ProY family transporter n=1 Tax=Paenibacillus sp. HB172176 TaxID=2493690 RepID=UPI00143B3914|nr:endospore germination permease [Paenibacillus sp. HB172176]
MSKLSGVTNGEVTSSQLSKMLYLFSLGSAALIVPSAMITLAKQDAWISLFLVIPFHFLLIIIYLQLFKRFPRLTIAQYAEKIAGKWLGKGITFSYVFFFLLLSSLVLRNMTDFVSKSVLPQTPDWFVGGTFMFVVVYGVYLGIETIARTGELLFIGGTLVMILITLILMNQMHLENLKPIMGNGWTMPFKGMYPLLGFPICEGVFITALLPLVQEKDREKLRKNLFSAVLLTVAVSALVIVLVLAVLGASEAIRSPFAVYEMVKLINIEDIVVRVEILFAVVFIGTVFMKLVLTVYVLAVLLAQMLGSTCYRPYVYPCGFLIAPLSLVVYRNSVHSSIFATDVWTVYSVAQGFLLPLFLLMAAVMLRKRSNQDGRFPIKESDWRKMDAVGKKGEAISDALPKQG